MGGWGTRKKHRTVKGPGIVTTGVTRVRNEEKGLVSFLLGGESFSEKM